MKDMHVNRIAGLGNSRGTEAIVDREPPRRIFPDLILARKALDRRRFADAERHLRRALENAQDGAEMRTLMGLLHERMGEHHAAYRCYRLSLSLDRDDTIASEGLRRYSHCFGDDPANPAVNPRPKGLRETVAPARRR
jgi:hypothetical protein